MFVLIELCCTRFEFHHGGSNTYPGVINLAIWVYIGVDLHVQFLDVGYVSEVKIRPAAGSSYSIIVGLAPGWSCIVL